MSIDFNFNISAVDKRKEVFNDADEIKERQSVIDFTDLKHLDKIYIQRYAFINKTDDEINALIEESVNEFYSYLRTNNLEYLKIYNYGVVIDYKAGLKIENGHKWNDAILYLSTRGIPWKSDEFGDIKFHCTKEQYIELLKLIGLI